MVTVLYMSNIFEIVLEHCESNRLPHFTPDFQSAVKDNVHSYIYSPDGYKDCVLFSVDMDMWKGHENSPYNCFL